MASLDGPLEVVADEGDGNVVTGSGKTSSSSRAASHFSLAAGGISAGFISASDGRETYAADDSYTSHNDSWRICNSCRAHRE